MRNQTQFQKDLNLTEFIASYGTEEQCFEALYRWRWGNGFKCPHYGHQQSCQLNTRKLQQCHRQTSVTAGTKFNSTKLLLSVWFLAYVRWLLGNLIDWQTAPNLDGRSTVSDTNPPHTFFYPMMGWSYLRRTEPVKSRFAKSKFTESWSLVTT